MSDDPNLSSQDAAGDASGKSQKSSAQQRIDQLVRRASEAERNNERLGEDNAQLLAQISNLTRQVESLSRAGTKPSEGNAQDVSPASVPSTPSGNVDLESLVQGAVTKALGTIAEQTKAQQAEADRLFAAQKATFDAAALDMPALKDQNSEEFRLFSQVFDGMPELNRSPRGPALAAEIVRGAISQARRGERDTASKKTQASLHQPGSPSLLDQADGGSRQEKAMAAVEALHKKGLVQGLSPEELGAYVVAAQATRPSED